MNHGTAVQVPRPKEHAERGDLLQQRWHGWGSPVGLGIGLLSTGGFFVLLTVGLAVLDSIG